MHDILVEQARRRAALKRGGDRKRVDVLDLVVAAEAPSEDILALDEVLQRLRDEDGADVLIMGCAGMANYRAQLQTEIGLPVVEPSQAAVSMALGQISLGLSHKTQRPDHA